MKNSAASDNVDINNVCRIIIQVEVIMHLPCEVLG